MRPLLYEENSEDGNESRNTIETQSNDPMAGKSNFDSLRLQHLNEFAIHQYLKMKVTLKKLPGQEEEEKVCLQCCQGSNLDSLDRSYSSNARGTRVTT
ncbi:hypothetical protein ScPMuIL_000122 [Solemya velum]